MPLPFVNDLVLLHIAHYITFQIPLQYEARDFNSPFRCGRVAILLHVVKITGFDVISHHLLTCNPDSPPATATAPCAIDQDRWGDVGWLLCHKEKA